MMRSGYRDVLIAGALVASAAACAGSTAGPTSTTPAGTDPSSNPVLAETETPAGSQTAQAPHLEFPNEPFRAKQPDPTEPRPFQLPPVKQFQLANGIQVYLLEKYTVPTVSVDLNFDGGARIDPADKSSLSSVCMDLMTEGTQALDKLTFSEALADIASHISSYAGPETQGVTMWTLRKHLDGTLALFADSVRRPGLRQEELERLLSRRLESLKQIKSDPSRILDRVREPVLYGAAHPFGRVTTEASYGAITINDCKTFHKRYIKPRNARLFVVGAISEAEVRKQFEAAFAGWSGTAPALPKLAKPQPRDGKLFFIDVPGAAQSAVSVAHFAPPRTAQDYMATEVMVGVLGGGFSGRINMNLREDKGYSYGAYGSLSHTRDYGVLNVGSSVRSDATYQAVVEMLSEMKALKSGQVPATTAELARERNGAVEALPSRFATARQALRQYRALVYHGLPLDYYNSFVSRVQAVSGEQVMAAATQHLEPSEARIVVVGDSKVPLIYRVDGTDQPLMKDGKQVTLLDGLKDLVASGAAGTGTVVVLDADGRVVKNP